MRMICLNLMLCGAMAAFAPNPQKVETAASSDKAFSLEVMIPAARAAVWQAFATSEGLSTWLTPGAVVDLRPGGEWTAHFPGGKTGGGTIVHFAPEQEITMAALAPEQFPTVRAERTTARFEFVPQGASTLVRL